MELKFLFKKFGAVVGGINISNNGVHIAAAGAKQTQKAQMGKKSNEITFIMKASN